MGNKLYVGNLSFNTTETDLMDLFAQAGTVSEAMIMQDRFTGKSRGFAFVTMGSDAEAAEAVNKFHGKTIDGRPLTVNEARPKEDRPRTGGGGGYGGGGGGGFRGDRGGGSREGGYRGDRGGGGGGYRDR
jgi:cold-inducible RNA-binding protein